MELVPALPPALHQPGGLENVEMLGDRLSTMGGGYLLTKLEGYPLSLAPALRSEISRIDPDLPITRLATYDDLLEESFWLIEVLGSIFTAFGLSALFLAAVGLYGVMAHSVTERTRETGIRRAIGAEGRHIFGVVLRRGLGQVVPGLVLGGGAALLVSRYLVAVLYRVGPRDPATFGGVSAVLLSVALASIIVPAMRAMRMDPVDALSRD